MARPPNPPPPPIPDHSRVDTDTGGGGFEIDGKTWTMDVGANGDPNGYGNFEKKVDVDKNLLDSSGKPKDISAPTLLTLAQYLSDVTMGKKGSAKVPNKYPVDRPSIPPKPLRSTSDSNGNPTGPTPVSDANTNNFGGVVDPYTQQFPLISPNLRKGKEGGHSGNSKDGNDLLRTAVTKSETDTSPDSTPLGTYQSAVMLNNRFSTAAGSKKFTDIGSGSDSGFNPELSQQKKMGTYDPSAPTITPGRMAAIGPLLTMRAGKELGASSAGADPNSGELQAAALLPGFGQLGITRIDQQLLLASDVLAGLTTDELDSANVLSVGSLSWGQLNNTDDPFSGTDALGMLVLSTALVAGIELLIDGLSTLLGLITPSTKRAARDAQGRYTPGEYYAGTKAGNKASSGGIGGALSAIGSLNFGALLGIHPTNFPFNLALKRGTNAFFGIPEDSGGLLGAIGGALSSAADSPGFNVVVARAIIRSSLTIVDQMKKIGGNVMNAITAILSLIDVIRSSKLIAACNVFATLGDAILTNPDHWLDPDSPGTKLSSMDSLDDNAMHSTVSKNRMKGSLKLAWSSNRAPANLILPSNILATSLAAAGKNMGAPSPFIGFKDESLLRSAVTKKEDHGRIPTGDADTIGTAVWFESLLESSYVPFYFHDVRTNEMISFHAFLASLTDDYTASYEKHEAFGRVEPVKIYKSTERRIALSFFIAATSPADFDDMWVKINKLVTLVYPQYTQGKQLQDKEGSYVFTQPFSQLIGASPLIRIRLGDLLRSNYSLFALGRLFGMGDPGFKVGGNTLVGVDALDQGALEALQLAFSKALSSPNDETYIPAPFPSPLAPDQSSGGGGISIPTPPLPGGVGGSNGPEFAPMFTPSSPCFEIKAKKLHPDNPKQIIGEVQFRTDPAFKKYYDANTKVLENLYNNKKDVTKRVIGGKYVFNIDQLTPTATNTTKLVAKLSALNDVATSNDSFGSDVSKFLGTANNAIAKSFADTAGKGLAGFIETMNFDWFDKVTWETEHGRIAPKICKVTMNFSPIHDISPGIDHNGYNRGPIYPVGPSGPQDK